jgi:fructoselysine-6-P-deglycase FrlB-like protein
VGPGLAAIVVATEPETRNLDVSLATELAASRAGVLLITQEAEEHEGVVNLTTGVLDRALAPAVSLLPSQLLAWRLAAIRGRQPGAYYRATKVTRRE